MNLSRDLIFALAIIAIISVLAIFGLLQEKNEAAAPPLLGSSNQETGGKALKLWLQKSGYRFVSLSSDEFELPEQTTLALMLSPETVTPTEQDAIINWVEAGGTLLLAEGDEALINRFDFSFNPIYQDEKLYLPQTPLLAGPMRWESAEFALKYSLVSKRTDYTSLLALDEQPIIVTFPQGEGRVILSATAVIFTNLGLQKEGNAGLSYNLIAFASENQTIWYDDWHHGAHSTNRLAEIIGPESWLWRTPSGQSFLMIFVIVFGALLWTGRGFGRAIPLPNSQNRRAPVEYIKGLANLNRRAGNRQAIAADYHLRLKRELGQRYRIDPHLPDDNYMKELAQAQPHLDLPAIQSLLQRLSRPNLSEKELINIAAEFSHWNRP